MTSPGTGDEVLRAPHVLEYTYTRSVGPVIGRFFEGLAQRRITGVRAGDGRVLVPPTEYDPVTGEAVDVDGVDGVVDVGDTGTVTTWSWVAEAKAGQPLDRPFAWAIIRLDGADTGLLHAVDAGDESAIATGARVRVRWRAQTTGDITDIECFDLEPGERA